MTFGPTRVILLGTSLLAVNACATKLKTVSLEDPAALRAASGPLVTVSEPAGDLLHSQSSKAGLGILGAGLNANAGSKLVKKGVLTDPSLTVESKLSDYIAGKSSLNKAAALSFEKRKDVPKSPKTEGGYTIDANTTVWGLNYFPLNWNSYQTYYSGNVRLLDPDGEVVAATHCNFKHPETKAESPEYDVLVSGGGVIMQQNLQIMADKCVEKFKEESLVDF